MEKTFKKLLIVSLMVFTGAIMRPAAANIDLERDLDQATQQAIVESLQQLEIDEKAREQKADEQAQARFDEEQCALKLIGKGKAPQMEKTQKTSQTPVQKNASQQKQNSNGAGRAPDAQTEPELLTVPQLPVTVGAQKTTSTIALDKEQIEAIEKLVEICGLQEVYHIAVARGWNWALETLVEKGAKIDADCSPSLRDAACGSPGKVVESLGKLRISKDKIKLYDDYRKLHYAVEFGWKDEVELLVLEAKIDVNIPDKLSGFTALHKAAYYGHAQIAQILLQAGAHADAVDHDGNSALHWAILGNNIPIIQALLEAKVNVNVDAVNRYGETPLHMAVKNNNTQIVSMLLQAGANPNIVDRDGETPLHKAAYYGQAQLAQMLLQAGAKVEAVDKDGKTALHNAAYLGHEQIAHILVNAGADANATRPYYRYTPLHQAAFRGNAQIAQILLQVEAGAHIDAVDYCGRTALHWAVSGDNVLVIQTLLQAGANVNIVDHDGQTALDLANKYKKSEIAQLLTVYKPKKDSVSTTPAEPAMYSVPTTEPKQTIRSILAGESNPLVEAMATVEPTTIVEPAPTLGRWEEYIQVSAIALMRSLGFAL